MKKILFIISTLIILCSFTTDTSAMEVTYTSLGVPDTNTYWKTWMDYGAITSKSSPQYKYLRNWCWIDNDGFVRASAETDLGIDDDYYAVALGSYYGTTIGIKYRVTLSSGQVIYCVLCDQKANAHTNSTHQYASHKDVLEFIVNTSKKSAERKPLSGNSHLLDRVVKRDGNANSYYKLKGRVSKIERINFIPEEEIS